MKPLQLTEGGNYGGVKSTAGAFDKVKKVTLKSNNLEFLSTFFRKETRAAFKSIELVKLSLSIGHFFKRTALEKKKKRKRGGGVHFSFPLKNKTICSTVTLCSNFYILKPKTR